MNPAKTRSTIHVPQFRAFVDHSDYAFIEPVFASGYVAEGPFSKQFHDELLRIIGSPYGVFASNGTLAIYLARAALGIGPGDEVIVQDVTFIASANAVEMTGAAPVFADIRGYNDLTIDLERLQKTPRTKAVVVAHLFGTACSNIEQVQQYCCDHQLWLIEDAAQAFAIRNGQSHCGTFGEVGTFSFYADKTITTGEGGFVVTASEDFHNRMVYLRNQGRKKSGTFVHPEIGYNFRITDLQAALGLSQLGKLDYICQEKQRLYQKYRQCLGDRVHWLFLRSDFSHVPFRVVVFVDDAQTTMEKMSQRGIEPRSMFCPLHRQPCYRHVPHRDSDFPNAIECFARGICLPTWIGLTDEQIEYTAETLLDSI